MHLRCYIWYASPDGRRASGLVSERASAQMGATSVLVTQSVGAKDLVLASSPIPAHAGTSCNLCTTHLTYSKRRDGQVELVWSETIFFIAGDKTIHRKRAGERAGWRASERAICLSTRTTAQWVHGSSHSNERQKGKCSSIHNTYVYDFRERYVCTCSSEIFTKHSPEYIGKAAQSCSTATATLRKRG